MARRDPLDTPIDIVSSGEGVYVRHLAPSTTILVRTLNTLYRMVIMQSLNVSLQGGALFPEPTAARLVGSCLHPGGSLIAGWIGIGLRIELRSGSQYVVTSAVRAITSTDPPRPEDGGRGAFIVAPNNHTMSGRSPDGNVASGIAFRTRVSSGLILAVAAAVATAGARTK